MPFDPLSVPLASTLVTARFTSRPNRFIVHAEREGRQVRAHLPDPGRLEDLLAPGCRLWLEPAPEGSARRTAWTARLVEAPDGERVSVDTLLPNRLVRAALEAGALPELAPYRLERAEPRVGSSRFDFLLRAPVSPGEGGDGRPLLLEVKGVSMLDGERALFPDAVTARGARHVRELGELAARGEHDAGVLFVVQRAGARSVAAAQAVDPVFADALAEARRSGLRVFARRARVVGERAELGEPLPVE